MTQLVIIRGLPGSGKSTMAQEYVKMGFKHYEADMYFERDGQYTFNPNRLRHAHQWCRNAVEKALEQGYNVVVSNTFTQRWEFEPYVEVANDLGAQVDILTATGNYNNVHGVPPEKIEVMKQRWED